MLYRTHTLVMFKKNNYKSRQHRYTCVIYPCPLVCTTNSVISPTPTAARALCGSSAISWIELVRSTLLALASSADFLPSCHSAIRDPIAYPALRFRASTLLSRENVSPLCKFVSRSRAKMDQALPPLFVRAGQRSYVDLLRGRMETRLR